MASASGECGTMSVRNFAISNPWLFCAWTAREKICKNREYSIVRLNMFI
jgi:hypothetical protein